MRTVDESEAKRQWDQLLDEVEHGETVCITRHGRTIARLEPLDEMGADEKRTGS